MKGIILAGGKGTRLHPLTQCVSKQLLPVYNKPMIYYPLSTFLVAGIKDILIITTSEDQSAFKKLLGNGSQWGIHLSYAVQDKPNGLPEAFLIAEDFINGESCALILGDNILFSSGLMDMLRHASNTTGGAAVFSYHVTNPQDYAVLQFSQKGEIEDIIEKPDSPPSQQAIIGLYFYDHTVVSMVKQLKPSSRGELEICDLNRLYLQQNKLSVYQLGRGTAWLDMGTPEGLLEAAQFVYVLEKRQGQKIADLDEMAENYGYIKPRGNNYFLLNTLNTTRQMQ